MYGNHQKSGELAVGSIVVSLVWRMVSRPLEPSWRPLPDIFRPPKRPASFRVGFLDWAFTNEGCQYPVLRPASLARCRATPGIATSCFSFVSPPPTRRAQPLDRAPRLLAWAFCPLLPRSRGFLLLLLDQLRRSTYSRHDVWPIDLYLRSDQPSD